MRNHPVHGGQRMHYGQDMAAPAGTPVNSMQAGRVSRIDRSGDVTVTHADGSTKTYRHIAPGGIREGQNVEAGGPLGRLRAHDPRSTGPHLHLEATDPQGRRYDPRPEVEAAQRRNAGPVEARSGRDGSRRPTAEGGGDGLRQIKPWTPQEVRPARPTPDTPVERPQLEQAAERTRDRAVTRPDDLPQERRLPRPDDPKTLAPRFVEPRLLEARARPAGEEGGGGRSGGAPRGGGPALVQHFHGGFDAAEAARRSVLERNREVRRSYANALGDVGRPG
ncbi:M23 family metallopeptidase [Methylobacterium aquaticum]|uniref:M23 family metallopeptidase n=1 Tax=Methylobacterium aquaticum TaxID=270351 RepID=UPI00193188CE|nr:M23 family metallopeptidase [Methylobacterium aquaticum]